MILVSRLSGRLCKCQCTKYLHPQKTLGTSILVSMLGQHQTKKTFSRTKKKLTFISSTCFLLTSKNHNPSVWSYLYIILAYMSSEILLLKVKTQTKCESIR